ncbi:unnamed protein product [Blepharisma stoltei]|uniref:Uncharacterized protein n=1 Tax=Blepharisma stoltei TaxID=1481888 RepID=A0AAU9JTW2_9CILI|nr:unnamed protein product [Blepharisma stoltei]
MFWFFQTKQKVSSGSFMKLYLGDFIFTKNGKPYYYIAELYLFSLKFIFPLVYLNIWKLISPVLIRNRR